MQWQKGDKYYIYYRDYKISRSWVRGIVAYSAWHRRELLGVFKSLDDAKHIVEVHETGYLPHGEIINESAAI